MLQITGIESCCAYDKNSKNQLEKLETRHNHQWGNFAMNNSLKMLKKRNWFHSEHCQFLPIYKFQMLPESDYNFR